MPPVIRFLLVAGLWQGAYGLQCGAPVRSSRPSRGAWATMSSATAMGPDALSKDMQIIEDSNAAEVVRNLAGIDLTHNRCHDITQDAPPDVDPFGLVKEELTPLSAEVRSQLEAQHEALTDDAALFMLRVLF